jgi:hypothetical protein
VTVTALCPGPTQSGFSAAAGAGSTRLYSRQTAMSSADVARAGYQGLNNSRRVVVTGLRNKLLVQSVRMSPRRVVTMVGRRLWRARERSARHGGPESKGGVEATVRVAKADLVPTSANLLPSSASLAELAGACERFCELVTPASIARRGRCRWCGWPPSTCTCCPPSRTPGVGGRPAG